ncbi:MAG: aminotransferase class V-fold PLP-dependent enzyme [Gemmatimonadetes bacterium]|nr:aminotransferase class V-fold PLP-dependent enzyme [Gemmatimonadota bacterium]
MTRDRMMRARPCRSSGATHFAPKIHAGDGDMGMAKSRQASGRKKAAKNGRSGQTGRSGRTGRMADTIEELDGMLAGAGPAEADNEKYWQAVRAQFPYNGSIHYTNNGTIGILPHMVLQAQIAVLKETEIQDGDTGGVAYPAPHEAHEKLAALINADPSEVAITRNSTESMNIIALGLDLKPEAEILTTTPEHYGG